MPTENFWLLEWLEEHDVKTLRDAERLLSDRAVIDGLVDYAGRSRDHTHATPRGESIVAGRGLDFSGHLDCNHPDCRRRQVDSLFRKAWHYFDRVIVADAVSHEISGLMYQMPVVIESVCVVAASSRRYPG